MLYPRKAEPALTPGLFMDPTAEYRGAPFWAWNTKLDKDELIRQIGIFEEMGIGGFHMHCRSGLQTDYLSKEFFDAVRACCGEAQKRGMFAYLYDEDRWPSGAAGGLVTKDKRYRQREYGGGWAYQRNLYGSRTDEGRLQVCAGQCGSGGNGCGLEPASRC